MPETTVTYVCVPRAVFGRYWLLPWADVVAAADAGVDGLTRQTQTPAWWGGRLADETPAQPDVAFMREGDGAYKGRTLLFQQNWFGDLIRIRMIPSKTDGGKKPKKATRV